MANQTKQYFLAPTWDYPPNGPISLGNIILSPRAPCPLSSPPPPPSTPPRPPRLGLWTKFVELVGLRLDWVAAGHTVDVFRFEQLQTEEWFPDEAFLTAALAHPAVQRRVGGWRRRAVYVVVGVKTVAGAEVKRAWYRGVQGARAEAAVDVGMAAGAPVPVTG
ncbi:085264aa-fb84-4513-9374-dac57e83f289 [Thermothielavioides terrestris]|uniref:085264aa-fb84-4513-9374-dac57e83f289 n=1 Tax=Thermothielavioides terrestris TaxID=2587410 RepID=A0A446BU56_9PEZI|nr:085264aa-fb84-4513-9374-dac57e83f289 [Thermothielavioides terrestris]